MDLTVDALPPEKLERAIARLEREKARRAAENWLAAYQPYPKQAEFHAAGATHRERLLMASNQTGKTLAAAMELTMHATGIRRGGSAGDSILRSAWACGETSEVVRETMQILLLGEPGQHGTGCIPKAALVEIIPRAGLPIWSI